MVSDKLKSIEIISIFLLLFSAVLSNGYGSNSPLTPSARISALNIVSDLLRKVGVSRSFFFTSWLHTQRPCLSTASSSSSVSSSSSSSGPGVQTRRLQELRQGPESEEGADSGQQQRAQCKHSALRPVAPHVLF